MSWAIERDERGSPVRMWWMGAPSKKRPAPVIKPGCPHCGYHFGWHTLGCQSSALKGEKP